MELIRGGGSSCPVTIYFKWGDDIDSNLSKLSRDCQDLPQDELHNVTFKHSVSGNSSNVAG